MKPAILIVDDEKNICTALKRQFDQRVYDVHEANNGQLALDILNHRSIDVIISDHQMPGMKGTEFLHIAKQRHPEVKRIMLSGQCEFDDLKNAINEADIHRFISKPWNDQEIVTAVNDNLPQHQLKKTLVNNKRNIPDNVTSIYPDFRQVHFDLEKAIANDELVLSAHPLIAKATADKSLSNLDIRWPKFSKLTHDGIVNIALQCGYGVELYQWYLIKSLDIFSQAHHRNHHVIIDVFNEQVADNHHLTELLQKLIAAEDTLLFRVDFKYLQQYGVNALYEVIRNHHCSTVLNIGKRIIDYPTILQSGASYLEMRCSHCTINNGLLTEKRLEMIRDAKNSRIKTILQHVIGTSQQHYANSLGVDYYSSE